MSPLYSLIAVVLVFTQRSQASYGHMHGGFVNAFPVAAMVQPAPVVAPVMAAPVVQSVPVVAAPPPVVAAPVAPVFPYAVHSHHYHPRAAIHNHVRAYHSCMLLPHERRFEPKVFLT
ncbi:hypothetical protein Y032_0096g2899 [Ancylostoma ceylanicum]|uniref:Uncharacterized protein n=1 Tax=Ancylostoma ceylanicum TaxID=53326 RepID=A0A016TJ72_9BILA|nr:hypothetical protein Y032_0096g2899 [Ancylostoma ceylanicum]